MMEETLYKTALLFNAAWPSVDRVHVLGSKKADELLFGHCMKEKTRTLVVEADETNVYRPGRAIPQLGE